MPNALFYIQKGPRFKIILKPLVRFLTGPGQFSTPDIEYLSHTRESSKVFLCLVFFGQGFLRPSKKLQNKHEIDMSKVIFARPWKVKITPK